jgi:hypothetical protein
MITPRESCAAARTAVLALAAALVAACGSASGAPEELAATAVLTAPAGAEDTAQRPIQDAELAPGTRYRFEGLLPSTPLELTGPEPPLYNYAVPGVVALSPDADFRTDALYLTDAAVLRVPADPFLSLGDIAGDADLDRLSLPAPADLLGHATGLPILEVVVAERPMTVGGAGGRAVDVRVLDLPPEAQQCGRGSGVGLPVCAVLVLPLGSAPLMQPGQELRLIELELPTGRVFVYQNLSLPEAQAVLDSLTILPPAMAEATE